MERIKEIEDKIIVFWKENRIYEKVKESRKGAKKFYFLDGPPYATGYIHVGTAMNKVLKDCYIRFFRMLGFDVWDQPGFDTHGLPIEKKVEEELGFKTKKDIEAFGTEKFIERCRDYATRFIGIMSEQFYNLGVWMDWSNPYLTLTNEYIEGAWFTFKKAFEKGLLYKGVYPVHVCPVCETVVAYNEIEYEKVEDLSIYVKFPILGKEKEFLIIWTTTPWTLPSNTGVMINPKFEYAKVKVNEEIWIVAKNLVDKLMKEFGIKDYKVVESKIGRELIGERYVNPLAEIFPFTKDLKDAYRVVGSEKYVSLEEGTGLVHTAPGHGKEDFEVGLENNLPIVNPLEMNGCFNKTSGKLSGIFAKDADKIIIEELKKKNVLIKEGKIIHDYPLCWRCSSPLLLQAIPQWFFKVTAIRGKLIRENEKINWVPRWAGYRFRNWLESLGDWPISRQRYWGIPLPIWVCKKCEKVKVIGSSEELPEKLEDLHKPHIDKIKLKCECGGEMERIPDVLDVWFDSGVAPWASLGYPKNKKDFEEMWPVDFILEGPDQIRGWWNSLMITGVITFDRAPFKNVLYHGFVLDAHGRKMSKSKGNIVTAEEVIEKYGRDVLRFFYLFNPPWNDYFFKWSEIEEINRRFEIIRNTFNFVKTYVRGKGSSKSLEIEDRWILSRLNSLIKTSTQDMKSFLNYKALQEIEDFMLNDFSRWYIKLVRERVWPEYEGKDKEAAFYTLLKVSEVLVKLLAPFCPFLSEKVYQDIKFLRKKDSVHLESWPRVREKLIDKKLEEGMEMVREIVEACYRAREECKIKKRWPVRRVLIITKSKESIEACESFNKILLRMCNAKSIEVLDELPKGDFSVSKFSTGEVAVDKTLDEEVLSEGLIRELIRKIQEMRKKNNFSVEEKIILSIQSNEKINSIVEKSSNLLKKKVGAKEILIGEAKGEYEGELEFKDNSIKIKFSKVEE